MNRHEECSAMYRAPVVEGVKTFYTQFLAESWSGNEFRIPAAVHHIPAASVIACKTLHMLVDGRMTGNTWGILESDVVLDRTTGDIVLTAGEPYAGELMVVACPLRGG